MAVIVAYIDDPLQPKKKNRGAGLPTPRHGQLAVIHSSWRLRPNRNLQRLNPVLLVGVVVQIRPTRRPAVLAGDAADQVQRHFDLLARREVAPVEDQLSAA